MILNLKSLKFPPTAGFFLKYLEFDLKYEGFQTTPPPPGGIDVSSYINI